MNAIKRLLDEFCFWPSKFEIEKEKEKKNGLEMNNTAPSFECGIQLKMKLCAPCTSLSLTLSAAVSLMCEAEKSHAPVGSMRG